MAEEFKAITTQEEFDAAIKSRLERERSTIQKQYADYESLKQQVADLTNEKGTWTQTLEAEKKKIQDQLDEANTKVKGLETENLKTKIAIEKGLPLELRTRLSGTTEEEIRADADSLAKLFSAEQRRDLPGFDAGRSDSGSGADKENAAYLKMLKDMTKKE